MTMYYDERLSGGSEIVDVTPPWSSRWLRREVVKPLAISLVTAALACGAGEYFLIGPRAAERDELRMQADAAAARNRENEATLVAYADFLAKKEEIDSRYTLATGAIPTEAELASVLGSIHDLAVESRVKLVSFTPQPPVRTAPAPGQAAPAAAQPAPVFGQRQIRVVVRGNYRDLENLLAALGGFSRMLTVDRFSAKGSPESGFSLEATLDVTCYFKQPPAAAK